ncbi:hypothetical protein DW094_00440 [Ruminococcaceae bacterium AM07-15]|nr:hypothetical protein DW094_00440 [Ruminococcaceae bacterium AM07-15]
MLFSFSGAAPLRIPLPFKRPPIPGWLPTPKAAPPPGNGTPPKEEVEFVLDRPFLFVITSNDGLPLFVGAVYRPS